MSGFKAQGGETSALALLANGTARTNGDEEGGRTSTTSYRRGARTRDEAERDRFAEKLGFVRLIHLRRAAGITSNAALYRARKAGRLPPTLKFGDEELIPRGEFDAWVAANLQGKKLEQKPQRGRPRKAVNPLHPLGAE